MTERASYSRVYWSIVDDPKFISIYDSDANLAAWLRLLLIADQSHPASAHLPANVRRSSVAALADVELIDLMPGSRYRVHGLDEERRRRREAATRLRTGRDPDGDQLGTGRDPELPALPGRSRGRDETRRDEENARAANDPFDEPEREAVVWLAKHGCDIRPGNGFHQKLVVAVEQHGVNAFVGMLDRLAAAGTHTGDTKGFVFGAIDALNARTRPNMAELEKADAAEERDGVKSKRISEQVWARRREWYQQSGQWDSAWGEPPSSKGVA